MLLVTDGAVDLPDTLLASGAVLRVPGEVLFGEVPFAGDIEEFWARLRKGDYPSTTAPTVSALRTGYGHATPALALHVSGELSATVARAQEAAGADVTVVDTRSLSVGAGLVVTAVHRAADGVNPPPSLVEFARSLPERLHTFALVQEVESLRHSDRASLLPSSHLVRNHPLVLAIRGRVVPLAQPKHRAAAIDELAKHLTRSTGGRPGGWALAHGDAADVDRVASRLTHALNQEPRYCASLDPTVGSHLGPEALVVGAITGPIDL